MNDQQQYRHTCPNCGGTAWVIEGTGFGCVRCGLKQPVEQRLAAPPPASETHQRTQKHRKRG